MSAPAHWHDLGDGGAVGVAERAALGTTARLVVWPPERLPGCAAAVDRVLDALDRQASRFRPDSELSRVQQSPGTVFWVSDGFAHALDAALRAARWTGGLVDPTVGGALEALGYDRDFAAIDQDPPDLAVLPDGAPAGPPGPAPVPATVPGAPAPGWSHVHVGGHLLERPPGVRLDLGATAKGLGADRATAAAARTLAEHGGVLVSLGGDLAVAGTPPREGWPVTVAEDPGRPDASATQVVRIARGALATSSVLCRQWRRGTRQLHHLVDPRTGQPADGPWRTVTVAARNCLTANAASTAAMVGGIDGARWLEATGLPARLVARDGTVHHLGAWPRTDGGAVDPFSGESLPLALAPPPVPAGAAR